jgi:tetratricopeptide (TPR) repeat protein
MTGISVADVLAEQNQNLDEALKLYRDAIAILDEVRPRYDNNVFECYLKIGDILSSRNDRDGALREYKRASGIARDSAVANQSSVPWQRRLATSYGKIGDQLAAQAPSNEARDQYQQALNIVMALAAEYPKSTEWPALAESLTAKIQNLNL